MSVNLTPEELQYAEATRQALIEMEEKDPSIWDKVGAVAGDIGGGLKEAPGQAVRGAQEALNQTSDTAFSMAKWLNDNIIDLGHLRFGSDAEDGTPFDDKPGFGFGGVVSWAPGMPEENNLRFGEGAMPGRADTVTGGLVKDVSQFVTGFAMAGRYLKTLGVPVASTTAGTVVQGMVKGAITDATAFDPHEERLSNLVEKYPRLSNPVTDYLAARDGDGEAEGRFKNALEGLALGSATEALLHAVRAVKLRRAGKQAEAEAALDDLEKVAPKQPDEPLFPGADEAPRKPEEGAATAPKGEGEQLQLDLDGGPQKDSPRETFGNADGDVKPGDMAADIPPVRPTPDAPDFQPAKKLVEMDDEQLRQIVSARVAEQGYGQGRNISGIRTDLMETEADINATMSALRRVYREETAKAMGGNADGARSWENTRRNADALADLIGEDPRLLLQRMQAIHKETTHTDAELLLYRDMLVTVNEKLVRIGEVIADPLGGTGPYKNRAEAYEDFAKHYELMANMQLMYKGVQTHFARTMNAMKLVAKARNGVMPADPSEMWQGGPRNIERLARLVVTNKENLKGNLQLTRGGFVNKFLGSVSEYWINSILSGPKTHMVNMASGLFNAAFVPAEKLIAGSLRAGTPEGRNQMLEAGLQYAGMAMSLRDSFRMAANAFKKGDPILDPTHVGVEQRQAISAANYGISDPITANIVDGLGTLVRLPSRFLASEDEFIKQMVYRGNVRAQALREGFQQGLFRDPKSFGEFLNRRLDEAVDSSSGMAKDRQALQMAREVTWTQDLKASTWTGNRTLGESLQGMAEAHPAFRLIMPFVRTPTNLMRFVWNRTPGLNLMRKQYADDFMGRNGPEAAATSRAQFLTGSALWATAVTYVADGTITGNGPADKDIRRALENTGWKPYSIRTVDENGKVTYTQYNRFDPFGMFFGLVADFTEVAGAYPENELDQTAVMLVTAVAKNLNNKSYLQGLVTALGALSEPDRKMNYFAQGLAGGFVPNFLNQIVKDDTTLREARSIVDAMRRRMPGYSEGLDPQRNILGEKQYIPPTWGPEWISPIIQSTHEGGAQPITEEWKRTPNPDVYDELARQMFIHNSALKPAPAKLGGVDLTKYLSPDSGHTAYDRYQELTGTVKVNGKTLKEALQDLITSPVYRDRLSDGDYSVNGSRIDQIRSVLAGYRNAAERQLRKEIPELHWDLLEDARQRALMKVQPQERTPARPGQVQ